MRRIVLLIVATLAFSAGFKAREFGGEASAQTSTPTGWRVYFSPRGGCTETVVAELGKAKSSVLVQAYSFTSAPIADGLGNLN